MAMHQKEEHDNTFQCEGNVGCFDIRNDFAAGNRFLNQLGHELMDAVRYGKLKKVSDGMDDLWMAHAVDMKRVREFDNNNEMVFSWRKSKLGLDHAWHATLYAFTAAKLLTTIGGFGGALPLLSTFKVLPLKQ